MAENRVTNREVKKQNRNRIYRYIQRNGVVSNPDIAYALKLSLPTVTQNTRELMEMGLIQEIGELESTGGRKARALSAEANSRMAAGLDITRNHVGFLLTNLKGEVLQYQRLYRPFEKSDVYFQSLNQTMEAFLEESGVCREKFLGIGISVPGIVDYRKREITDSHALDLRALSFQEVERYFSCPCQFLNDANAGAYAEGIQSGEAAPFFYLSLSNTVGGAVYRDGSLVYGSEFRCGEVGHMTVVPDGLPCYCGKKGCLDSYCTAKVLANRTGGRLEAFFEGLEEGQPELAAAWEQYTDYLALAVNNIRMILGCDIVLGGYVGSYAAGYLEGIRKKAASRNTFLEDGGFVKACRYKVGAAALGAALYVLEGFIENI